MACILRSRLVVHYDNLVTDFDGEIVCSLPGQGYVGVTPVCVIVVIHVKTLLLLIVLPF